MNTPEEKYVVVKKSRSGFNRTYTGPTWEQAGLDTPAEGATFSFDLATSHAGLLSNYNPVGFLAELYREGGFPAGEGFQAEVRAWVDEAFGPENTYNTTERAHRFLEESLELVQSTGVPESDASMLLSYVYGRPKGETYQELGGTLTTLAALADSLDENLELAGAEELSRCWKNVDKIREKQKSKPAGAVLPGNASTPDAVAAYKARQLAIDKKRYVRLERDMFWALLFVVAFAGLVLGYSWCRAQENNRKELCSKYGLYCDTLALPEAEK